MTDKPSAVFTEMPCLIELYGHNQIAGKVSEVSVAGSALLRVDVPAVDGLQAFTKYYGMGAIYAITPTDEKTMVLAVKAMQPKPINRYQFSLPEPSVSRNRLSDLDDGLVTPQDDGRTIQDEILDIESGDFDPEDYDDDDFDDFDDFGDDEDEEEDFGTIADREYARHKDDLDTDPYPRDEKGEPKF